MRTLTLTLSGLSLVALLGATPARANVIYDEAIDGDLSGDKTAPTVLHLNPGANTFRGTVARLSPTSLDADLFTFTLPTSRQLVLLIHDVYTGSDDVSFIAFQKGSVWTTGIGGGGAISAAALLGWAHFGTGTPVIPGTVGTDILDDMSIAPGAQGFTPPLGGGTYTGLIQQTSLPINYQFTAVVRRVPEPSTLALLGLGLGVAGISVRRRSR